MSSQKAEFITEERAVSCFSAPVLVPSLSSPLCYVFHFNIGKQTKKEKA